MNLEKNKWVILAVILVTLVSFDLIVYNTSLVDRGIVVGIGIDLIEDTGEFKLSCQFVLPKNGGVSAGDNNHLINSAIAKTLDEALGKMSTTLGLLVSIAHVRLIILGDKLVKSDKLIEVLKYFYLSNIAADNTQVVASERTALDIMNADLSVGGLACYQIRSMLGRNREPLGIVPSDLKDYFMHLNSSKPFAYLPLVKMTLQNSNSDQQKDKINIADYFLIDEVLLFNQDGYQGKLDKESTLGFSLIRQKIHTGAVLIKDRNGEEFAVEILETKSRFTFSLKNKEATLNIKVKIRTHSKFTTADGYLTSLLNNEELTNLDNLLQEYLDKCLRAGIEANCEVLGLYDGFYKKYGNKVKTELPNGNTDIKLKYDINFTQR